MFVKKQTKLFQKWLYMKQLRFTVFFGGKGRLNRKISKFGFTANRAHILFHDCVTLSLVKISEGAVTKTAQDKTWLLDDTDCRMLPW